MKKQTFAMLLLAASLGMSSCNDIQELNLNFGERTYINDYKSLVEAVNNLSLSLKERFDALSKILEQGMADLKVSIDKNTGAITVVGQNVAVLDKDVTDGLQTINTSLFNGFKAISSQIETTGNSIVAAIDNNGNLLRLQIDSTGKLIAAQLVTSTADLVKVMKDNNASLIEKLQLVDASIKAGFGNTAEAQKAINEAIKALKEEVANGNISNEKALTEIKNAINNINTELSDKLMLINASLTQGFIDNATAQDLIKKAIFYVADTNHDRLTVLAAVITAQTTSLEAKLSAIETATKNGLATLADKNDLIKQAIASLEAEVKDGKITTQAALQEIRDAIKNQTLSLEGKLSAIELAYKNGLATAAEKIELIKTAVNSLTEQVSAGNTSTQQALSDIKSAVTSQTTDLSTKIGLLQTAMATGFANNKTAIESISSNIVTAINNLKAEVQTGNTNNATYLSQLVSGLSTLNTTTGATNTQLGNIKDVLTKELADNGVTIDPDGDGKSVLVTPDIWNDIENAGATSNLYNTFMDAIKDITLPKVINPTQVTPGTWHTCASFINDGYDANTVALRAGTLQPMTAANGKTVIKVIKTPSEVKFHIEGLWRDGHEWCTYPYIYNIRVFDARGDYQVYGGADGNETGNRATIGEATSRAVPTAKLYTANIILKAYYNGRICDEVKAYVFTYKTTNPSESYNGLPNLFWPSTPDPKP